MIKQWILTKTGMFVSFHALAHHGDWWWRCGRLECQLPDMPTRPAQTKLLNTTAGLKIILPLQDTWRHQTQHFTSKSTEAALITKRLQTSQPSQKHRELHTPKTIPLFWHMTLCQWVRGTWHFNGTGMILQ